MARYPRTRTKPSTFDALAYIATALMITVAGTMTGIWLMTHGAVPAAPAAPPLPTAAIARPAPSYSQVEATSQVIYQATAQAVESAPRVNLTNDVAPVVRESIPSSRQAAPAIVPTAEPIPTADAQFGSKEILVNPQQSHSCRHAQVWTDAGCKNPTPVK